MVKKTEIFFGTAGNAGQHTTSHPPHYIYSQDAVLSDTLALNFKCEAQNHPDYIISTYSCIPEAIMLAHRVHFTV